MSPEETNLHRPTYLTWARGYLKKSVISIGALRYASHNKAERASWGNKLGGLLNRWPELRRELSPAVPSIAEFLPLIVEFLISYDAPPRPGFTEIVPVSEHLEKIAEASARLDQPKAALSDVMQLDESIRGFESTTRMIITILVEQVRIRELLLRVHGQLQVPTIKAAIKKQYSSNPPNIGYRRKLPEIVEEQIMLVQRSASRDLRYTMTSWAAISLREMSSHWATYCAFLCEYLKDYGKEEGCLKRLEELDNVARCLDKRIEGWRTMTADELAGALGKTAVIFQYSWSRSKGEVVTDPELLESKGKVVTDPELLESKGKVARDPESCEVMDRSSRLAEVRRKLKSLLLPPDKQGLRIRLLESEAHSEEDPEPEEENKR